MLWRFCLIIFLFLVSLTSQAGTISSVSQTQGIDFGTFDPRDGGTIKSGGTISGDINSLGGFQDATFTVNGNAVIGLSFRVFLVNHATTISNGSQTMAVQFSLDPNSIVTSADYLFPLQLLSQTKTVEVYGTLTAISNQAAGSYSGSYTFFACDCTLTGCPSSHTDSKCD